jgi:hypothetical protein
MAWDAEQAFAELAAAAAWYRQAAEQGHSISQYNLGLMYDNGEGVAEDNAEAVRWFRLAADQGHGEARDRLAMLGDGDRIDPFGGEVPEDDNEAIAWFQERANAGNAAAQFEFAELYELGVRTHKNERVALIWYTRAADQGHIQAQYNLGLMYDHGTGVAEDDVEAARLYRLAAEAGHAEAQYHLAEMYEFGWGVREDDSVALYWHRKATDQGHEDARDSAESLELIADVDRSYASDDETETYYGDDDDYVSPRSGMYCFRSKLSSAFEWFIETIIFAVFRVGGHWLIWGGIGHGDHWTALFGDPDRAMDFIDGIAMHGLDISDDDSPYVVRTSNEGPLRGLVILEKDDDEGLTLVTAFPYAIDGATNMIEVGEVEPWGNGAEGRLAARFDDARIDFFDSLHYRNKDRYPDEVQRRFRFAGIAFAVGPVDAEALAEGNLAEDAAILLPIAITHPDIEGRPDWYSYQTRIRNVERVPFADGEVLRLDVVQTRAEMDFEVVLYASGYALPDGYVPQTGDIINGALWLNGLEDDTQ